MPHRRPSESTRYSPGASWRFFGRSSSSVETPAAALPQWFARWPLVGIYAIARRIGFDRADSLFAALLSATLTQVALQSVTTQNDLFSASFIVAAAALIIHGSRAEVLLAGLGIALALGTKLTTAYAIPVLLGLAVATLPRRRLAECAAAAVGAFAMSEPTATCSTSSRREDPSVTRPQPSRTGRTRSHGLDQVDRRAHRLRFFDLSGLHTKTVVANSIESAGRSAFDTLRIEPNPPETSVEPPFDFAVGQSSSEDISYFGPLGVLLVLPLSLGFTVATIVRRERWERLALAVALPLTELEIALTYRYNLWLGRFLITPVLLTMPLAAVLYRRRALAAVAALCRRCDAGRSARRTTLRSRRASTGHDPRGRSRAPRHRR